MRDSLVKWILNITKSQPELSGLPICPYAKQAYIANTYDIQQTDFHRVETDIANCDLIKYQVVVLYFTEYEQYSIDELVNKTKELNQLYNNQDIVILDNDPREPLIIKGVQTTFDDCYLWIIQPLADLNSKTEQLRKTKYYSHWTQEQLDDVVTWRFKTN